jgi:hypothetical protein
MMLSFGSFADGCGNGHEPGAQRGLERRLALAGQARGPRGTDLKTDRMPFVSSNPFSCLNGK